MAQLTQLNLEGKPKDKSTEKIVTQDPHATFTRTQKAAAMVASVMFSLLLGGFFLGTGGCSKKEPEKPAVALATSAPLPAMPVAAASQPTPPKKTGKRSVQRRLSTASYSNPTYAISFQYPKNYVLKTGDDAILHWNESRPTAMDFVKTGGLSVAAIELPRGLFPRDSHQDGGLSSAFFNVSVNSNLSASECQQFAFPEPVTDPAGPVLPSKITIGTLDFDEVADTNKQADAHYYHVFKNGACYEFGLALVSVPSESAGSGAGLSEAKEQKTEANSQEVFRKLEKILATVKIKEPTIQEGASAAQNAGPAVHPPDGNNR
jgi:hypothetical protein